MILQLHLGQLMKSMDISGNKFFTLVTKMTSIFDLLM